MCGVFWFWFCLFGNVLPVFGQLYVRVRKAVLQQNLEVVKTAPCVHSSCVILLSQLTAGDI